MKELYIIGSGGFSKQVIEIVEEQKSINEEYHLAGIIDDNPELLGKDVLGYKIVGDTDYLNIFSQKQEICAVIAIANGKVKQLIHNKLKNVKWINIVHPKAIISKYVTMGQGNIFCAGVIINPQCSIGNHCHINIGSTLGHDVVLKDFVTVMPGCHISGYVKVKEYSTIGTGASIIQGINIEKNVCIGAGATVVKDTEENSVYVGVPAKKLKDNWVVKE